MSNTQNNNFLHAKFPFHLMTMAHGHLNEVERTLEHARLCILGKIPEPSFVTHMVEGVSTKVKTFSDAKIATLVMIEESLSNHYPSLKTAPTELKEALLGAKVYLVGATDGLKRNETLDKINDALTVHVKSFREHMK